LKQKEDREVKVHDISRVVERMKALKQGILKIPTIVVNGIKCQGLDEIAQADAFRPTL
jgi:glutaredoxin